MFYCVLSYKKEMKHCYEMNKMDVLHYYADKDCFSCYYESLCVGFKLQNLIIFVQCDKLPVVYEEPYKGLYCKIHNRIEYKTFTYIDCY